MQENIEARKLQLLALKAFTVFTEAIENLAKLRGITNDDARKEVEGLITTYAEPVQDPDPENKIFDHDEAETH